MSLRNHRGEGKKYHKGRMPAPSEAKLGTRVHDHYEEQFEEDIPEVEKCPGCGHFVEVEDLDENDGVCYDCSKEQS